MGILHMKKGSKLRKVIQLIKEHPEKSNKEIGAMAKADPNYVAKIRRNEKQAIFRNEARVVIGKPRPKNRSWFLDEAIDRVHKSNMSKLDEDGNPIYREDGKVLKGPNYKPPNLSDLF